MRVEIVLVMTIVALSGASIRANEIEITKKMDEIVTHPNTSSAEIQPSPNHSQRGNASFNSIDERNNSVLNDKLKRRPLRLKILPTIMKMRNKNYWKTATTRKPLMKYTKFTIKPFKVFKLPETVLSLNNNVTEMKRRTSLFNKIMNAPKKDESSEEMSDSSDRSDNDNGNRGKNKTLFSQVLSRVKNETMKTENGLKSKKPENESPKNVTKEKSKFSVSEFSSEEREDRDEFIFVKPQQISGENIEESEVTTTSFEGEPKRTIRSINVIEEENLGTTVSGFKFTGKAESLSSDLFFKNINA